MVVDNRRETDGHIVLGHTCLLRYLGSLDLHIDGDDLLAEGVDLDETRVDGLVEAAELGDKTNVALLDVLVRVWAEDAAGNGANGTNASAKSVGLNDVSVLLPRKEPEEKAYSSCRTSPWDRRPQ